MRLAVGLAWLALVALPCSAATAQYEDAWLPATEAAAEAAVAKLGATRGRALVATVRNVPALASGTAGTSRGLKANVQDLQRAMSALAGTETELEVRIELPGDVLFDVDRDEIRPDASKALAQLATVIRAHAGAVRLVGHTDSDGSDAHNLDLSRRRAASVRAWLVARESIDAARLATHGAGESRPRVANDTAANKQLNRRVEVVVRKR